MTNLIKGGPQLEEEAFQQWKTTNFQKHFHSVFNVEQLTKSTLTGEVIHLSGDNTLEDKRIEIETAIAQRQNAERQQEAVSLSNTGQSQSSWLRLFKRNSTPSSQNKNGIKPKGHNSKPSLK